MESWVILAGYKYVCKSTQSIEDLTIEMCPPSTIHDRRSTIDDRRSAIHHHGARDCLAMILAVLRRYTYARIYRPYATKTHIQLNIARLCTWTRVRVSVRILPGVRKLANTRMNHHKDQLENRVLAKSSYISRSHPRSEELLPHETCHDQIPIYFHNTHTPHTHFSYIYYAPRNKPVLFSLAIPRGIEPFFFALATYRWIEFSSAVLYIFTTDSTYNTRAPLQLRTKLRRVR